MYYDESTGCYQNDFMENVFEGSDNLFCSIPYNIDRNLYDELLNKHKLKSRNMSTVVKFSFFLEKDAEGVSRISLFVDPVFKNNEDDNYDVIGFRDEFSCGDVDIDDYNSFIKELSGCIIGIDMDRLVDVLKDKMDELQRIKNDCDKIVSTLKAFAF